MDVRGKLKDTPALSAGGAAPCLHCQSYLHSARAINDYVLFPDVRDCLQVLPLSSLRSSPKHFSRIYRRVLAYND